jgi:hypothetical protein
MHMSSYLSGVALSNTISTPAISSPTRAAPSAAPAETAAVGDQSLQALQNLMQQMQGAANTKAIPAHQSW